METTVSTYQMQQVKTLSFDLKRFADPELGEDINILSSLRHAFSESTDDDSFWYADINLQVKFEGKSKVKSVVYEQCNAEFSLSIRVSKNSCKKEEFLDQTERIGLQTLIPEARAAINSGCAALQAMLPYHIPLMSPQALIDERKKRETAEPSQQPS